MGSRTTHAIMVLTRCAMNQAERCWVPNISASFSEEMPLEDEIMSQRARNQTDTGRRELSMGVPVRMENCRAQARQR